MRPTPLSRTLALVPPAVLLVAQHANAGFNTFIKIGDIKGESVDSKHADWIELNSAQWSVGRSISTIGGGNREAGNPSITELTITKIVDKSTPYLFLNAVGGSGVIPTVTLELVNPSTNGVFYRLTLSDVMVSSQSNSAATGADRPEESVSLNFAKIKIEYFYQDPKGGLTAVPAVGFDLLKNETF